MRKQKKAGKKLKINNQITIREVFFFTINIYQRELRLGMKSVLCLKDYGLKQNSILTRCLFCWDWCCTEVDERAKRAKRGSSETKAKQKPEKQSFLKNAWMSEIERDKAKPFRVLKHFISFFKAT